MFHKFQLDLRPNLFDELSIKTDFEDICKGRLGAVLVQPNVTNNSVPIVRTTSVYKKPAQKFLPIHDTIIEKIRSAVKIKGITDLQFNNALIEIYDPRYATMGYHSDQALDLAPNSFICIFSCYQKKQDKEDTRELIVNKKGTEETFKISLDNNSIVLFDLSTNSQHLHKIILESSKSKNKWLGITFRLSKTFIHFVNELPFFVGTDEQLVLANDDQKKLYFKLRGQENQRIEFEYPKINYTISQSDMVPNTI